MPEIEEDGDYDESSESNDDESTLDEEENMENEGDVDDEIAALQQEQDLPLEDLMKLYGNGCVSSKHDASEQVEVGSAAPSASTSFAEEANVDEPADVSEQVRKYFEGSDDDDEVDDDYIPKEAWKKEIRIGPEYQADVPEEDVCQRNGVEDEKSGEELIWNPDSLDDSVVVEYLTNFYRAIPENGDGPKGDSVVQIPDDERALKMFYESKYDVGAALDDLSKMVSPFSSSSFECNSWTNEDMTTFEDGLKVYGKNFYSIQQDTLPHKSVGDLVRYYYYWKKTERHDEFVRDFRFEKRQFHLNPTTTDYADHLLDGLAGNAALAAKLAPDVDEHRNLRAGESIFGGERRNHQGAGATHYNVLWCGENNADSLPTLGTESAGGSGSNAVATGCDADELPNGDL